jgi:hypothetical protein
MNVGSDFVSEAQVTAQVALIGALPDAPLAMPKQRLEPRVPLGRRLQASLIWPFPARTGRSEG